MRLILVRHGDALPAHDDAARVLSPRGRADVERLAARLASQGVRVEEILHSGLVRARQTAEILATALRPPRGVAVMRGIRPDDDEAPAAAELAAHDDDLLVVSHMTLVERLTARLLGPLEPSEPYATAEARALVRTPEGWTRDDSAPC